MRFKSADKQGAPFDVLDFRAQGNQENIIDFLSAIVEFEVKLAKGIDYLVWRLHRGMKGPQHKMYYRHFLQKQPTFNDVKDAAYGLNIVSPSAMRRSQMNYPVLATESASAHGEITDQLDKLGNVCSMMMIMMQQSTNGASQAAKQDQVNEPRRLGNRGIFIRIAETEFTRQNFVASKLKKWKEKIAKLEQQEVAVSPRKK